MGGKGPSQQTIDTQNKLTQDQIQVEQGQLSLEQDANKRAQQLYDLTEPGMAAAESFYKMLSTGDPATIQRATAPATEQIAAKYNQTSKALGYEMPRGGARDIAIEEAQISKEGAIGSVDAQAYLQSFPALASLASGGIGLSMSELSAALAAFSGASQSLTGASQSNQAAGQMEGAGKAETLGFLASLGNSAATGAGLAMSGGCWIAEAIYGKNNLRTARLRVWLNEVYGKTFVGSIVMFLYRHCGRFVARMVERYSFVRKVFTVIFDYADAAAYRWEAEKAELIRRAIVI